MPRAKFASVTITNGLATARVYLPDPQNGYYRGIRFDHSGMVGHLECLGHTFFGELKKPHNPKIHDHTAGPVEEFDMAAPPGYAAARSGQPFLKIGVGVLERKNAGPYQFYGPYKVLNWGPWTVDYDVDWIEFSQEIDTDFGYGYHYVKRVSLPKGKHALVLDHRLHNTGKKKIKTVHYNHNMLIIDGRPIRAGYAVKFPFTPRSSAELREDIELSGRAFKLNAELKGHFWTALSGALKNEYCVEDRVSGAGMAVKGNLPAKKFNLYGERLAICPEPFVEIQLAPGAVKTWNTRYRFYTLKPTGKA